MTTHFTNEDIKNFLIEERVFFNHPILQEKDGILKCDMKNFLEIYHILIDALKIKIDYNKKSLIACDLLEKHRHTIWDNADKYDDEYGTSFQRKLRNWFSIEPNKLDDLIELVIMPTINN